MTLLDNPLVAEFRFPAQIPGLRVHPLAQRAIESVRLNGQPLERRESLTLQAGSLPGWKVESDGTLIAFSG
jgi:hypothetical protein